MKPLISICFLLIGFTLFAKEETTESSDSMTQIITVIVSAITAIIVAIIQFGRMGTATPKDNEKKMSPDSSGQSQLAKKISQSQILIKFIPVWLKEESQYDQIPTNASDEVLDIVSAQLLAFIEASIEDKWSAEFFKTQYDSLPEIEVLLKRFREDIKEFKSILERYSQNRELLKMDWGFFLREDLLNLRKAALIIKEEAERINTECIVMLSHHADGE